jgi:mannosylglycerate hydrolase
VGLNPGLAYRRGNPSQSSIDGVIEAEIALPANSDAAVTQPQYGGTSFRIYDCNDMEIPYQVLEIKRNSAKRMRAYRDIPRLKQVDRYKIAFHAQIPPFGYAAYRLKKFSIEMPGEGEYWSPKLVAPVRYQGSMQVNPTTWDNGRVRLRIRENGTIDIKDHQTGRTYAGLLLLEDEADIGEGWNHVAPITNETFSSYSSKAVVSAVYDGPLQTRLRIRTFITVSERIEHGEMRRSEQLVKLQVTTFIDLRKNDPVVRCRTVVDNRARDHRLRLLFPTGLAAERCHTNTPFDLVEREVKCPDYSQYLEKERNVVPHSGIVALYEGQDAFAIYSKGLYEVTVRDDEDRTVALTLFRSTGKEVLSDGSDGGQLLGKLEFHYAIRPLIKDENYESALWREQLLYAAGIRFIDRMEGKVYRETPQTRLTDLPLRKSFLDISAPELIVSSIKQSEDRPGRYIIRLFNVTHKTIEGSIIFDRRVRSARYVNLDEQHVADLPAEGSEVIVKANCKQIITIEVSFQEADLS